MKKGFTNYWLLILFLSVGMQLWAQAPDGYYSRAEKKSSAALKSELFNIISNHKVVSYDGLWTVYRTSDIRPDGTVWDMYSTVTFRFGSGQCGGYKLVGDCYNREHSFPKSWFSEASPMVSDAFHIYPTDGKVNGQRSSFAYGETANGTQLAASSKGKPLGKLGPCSFPDCSGTVFEPVDEYKGDFARTYFYMATRYQDRIKGWKSPMLGGDDYKPWAINLLLKWHRQDPISKKETDRNNAVYEFQHNRNPFIDYPELVEYIWGNKKGQNWIPGGETTPMLIVPVNNTSIDMGVTAVNKQLTTQVQVKGQGLTENLIVNVNGIGFSTNVQTLNFEEVNRGTTLSVSFSSANAVNAEASLTLSNGQVSSTIQLTAQTIDGIPALPAENVSLTSFTACWMDVDKSGNYMLNVMNADGSSLVGYPVQVATTAQKHEVSGLQSNTTYQYQLSKGNKTSNKITVTTAAPIPVLELISPAGGLIFGTKPGEASEIKEVEAYTENITEDIKATISAPFEISLNKEDWARELMLDRKGESFYVRISATASAGTHTGTLSLSTATIDGDEVDVTGTVALPRV
ncbi:MAG: endonuclease, partial [Bacteroides sp.]